MIHGYLEERDPKRRIQPPSFVFLLVAVDLPLPLTFRQTFKNSVLTTMVATFTFVKDTYDIETRLDAGLVASIVTSVEYTAKDWRMSISIE